MLPRIFLPADQPVRKVRQHDLPSLEKGWGCVYWVVVGVTAVPHERISRGSSGGVPGGVPGEFRGVPGSSALFLLFSAMRRPGKT